MAIDIENPGADEAELKAALQALTGYGVKAYAKASSAGETGVNRTALAVLALATENYDVGGLHSTSSNTGRMTIPAAYAGKLVQLNAFLQVTSITAGGYILMLLRRYTSADVLVRNVGGLEHTASSTGWTGGCQAFDVPDSGDYYQIEFQTNADTSVDINSNSYLALTIFDTP